VGHAAGIDTKGGVVIFDAIRHTTTCSVCGFACGIRDVQLACCCRGWVAFWWERLAVAASVRR
jgi:hypothetical protein